MGPAVAVFIGAVFKAIVALLTFSTINPLLKAVIDKPNFDYLSSGSTFCALQ
jgi:large-conductance mechanosensitive channel